MADDLDYLVETFEVKAGQVVKHRREDGELVALINYGVGGIKKYRLPLADVEAFSVRDDPNRMTVKELQQMARDAGVSYSGLRKDDLIDAILARDEEE